MLEIRFYDPAAVRDDRLVFAVIITKSGGRWVLGRVFVRRLVPLPGDFGSDVDIAGIPAKWKPFPETDWTNI